ncbi:MAG: 2-dehydropantoate 2-reductase [Halieaceae bacterium]|jgi:2-dehydropantoate 2-reductase
MSDDRHWHVLGAGAIGTLLAHRLREAGIPCTLVHHTNAGSRLLLAGSSRHRIPVATLQQQATGSIRRLLLTTKAPALPRALEGAQAQLHGDAIVATTANGLGFETRLSALAPGQRLYRAVSTDAAYREGPGTVVHTATGETRMGQFGQPCAPPAWFVDSLGKLPGWYWEPDIDRALHRKFAINCIINPLTAALRCRNGRLLSNPAHRTAMLALCEESEPALRVLGLWRDEDALSQTVAAVCESTRDNLSSMLQDVLAERETELAYLTGELLRRAAGQELDLPLNRSLWQRLQAAPESFSVEDRPLGPAPTAPAPGGSH